MDFLLLLRRDGKAKRKEHDAKSTSNKLQILTVARCREPVLSKVEGPACDHLITRSARASTFCGIVRPIRLAALRLITSSNFVGCSTERSAAFAPFTILST